MSEGSWVGQPRALRQRSGDAEAHATGADMERLPLAPRRAKGVGSVVPPCAAYDAKAAVSSQPRTAVAGVACVSRVPTILGPIPGIAMDVIEAPRIGSEAVYGHRRPAALAGRAARIGDAAIVVGLVR